MDAVIIYSLARHFTLEDADEIENFFKLNPLPSSERKIAQTIEAIRNTGKMLNIVQASSLVNPTSWV
jgi:hypothetical protein